MGILCFSNVVCKIYRELENEGNDCKMYNYERFMNVAREYPEGMIATPLEFEKIMGDWIDVK